MKIDQINNSRIVLANDWLLNSGIQNMAGEDKGGFNSWFDMEEDNYSYVYSEITGYGITTLLYLYRFFKDDVYLTRAIEAFNWLKTRAEDECGGVRTRNYLIDMSESDLYSFNSGNIYAFDNGMVMYGAVNLYKATKKKEHLDLSVDIADFMIQKMLKKDGLFYAVYNSNDGTLEDSDNKWSTQSGSYHAKLALGYTDLFEVTLDEKYKKTAVELCERSIAFQMPSGRFITNRKDNSTHFHPHLYSAEGLLYAGIFFARQDFVEKAGKAIKWALDSVDESGNMPKKFDGKDFIKFPRCDTYAQVLRLGSLAMKMGAIDKKYSRVLDVLYEKLLEFQYVSDNKQSGGFYYGYTLDGEKKKHLNSWCTMFSLQALMMCDKDITDKDPEMRCFV